MRMAGSDFAYAAPAWSGFVFKAQEGINDAFLRRSYRCELTRNLLTFIHIVQGADRTVFRLIALIVFFQPHEILNIAYMLEDTVLSFRMKYFSYY